VSLTPRQIIQLRSLVFIATELLAAAEESAGSRSGSGAKLAASGTRVRRSGKDLAAFRKLIKTERKRGVSVAELAKRHGVSTAYIYQLK
jgi:hypothetical protein